MRNNSYMTMRNWWACCCVGLASLFWAGCSHTMSVISVAPSKVYQNRELGKVVSFLADNYHVSVVENSGAVVVVIPNKYLFMKPEGLYLREDCQQLVDKLVQLVGYYPECAVQVDGCYPDESCQNQSLMFERARMLEALMRVRGMHNASKVGDLNICMVDAKDSSLLVLYKIPDRKATDGSKQ